ncbi:thiamine pyrophosphate-binding protein [Virgibacillus oceani]
MEDDFKLALENTKEFTVADAIIKELVKNGVEKAFGIVSVHNLPIYDAIAREGSIELITARGESGAVNMADGYSRANGKLGVVITSTGTGAGNAAGSLVEAWSAGTPLLHITGEIESPYINQGRHYIHEAKDQLSMMDGASKKAYRLRKPEQAYSVIRRSIDKAFEAPTGPVTLEIPIDYQSAIISDSNIKEVHKNSNSDFKEQVFEPSEELLRKITAAQRPVIWAGGGVIKSGASEEITELAEMLGAAVITSQAGKGSIPENHPLCVGYFSSNQVVRDFVRNSDFMLSVGTQFRSTETGLWDAFVPEEHISINTNIHAFNLNYPVTQGIAGDAKLILSNIIYRLKGKSFSVEEKYTGEVKQLRDQVRKNLLDTLGPYKHFASDIRKILPREGILVRDVTVPANLWGSRVIDTLLPGTSIYTAGGGIGQGLPLAIGAQVACKEHPVVLMAGDGGFLLNIGEMATAAQENLPITVLLFDDAGFGVLRGIQDATYGNRVAVDLQSPDFVQLGESMGFNSKPVRSAAEFTSVFTEAVSSDKPSLIVVDMHAVGPVTKKYAGTPGAVPDYQPKKIK